MTGQFGWLCPELSKRASRMSHRISRGRTWRRTGRIPPIKPAAYKPCLGSLLSNSSASQAVAMLRRHEQAAEAQIRELMEHTAALREDRAGLAARAEALQAELERLLRRGLLRRFRALIRRSRVAARLPDISRDVDPKGGEGSSNPVDQKRGY